MLHFESLIFRNEYQVVKRAQQQFIPHNPQIGTTQFQFGPWDPHLQFGTLIIYSSWILGTNWSNWGQFYLGPWGPKENLLRFYLMEL